METGKDLRDEKLHKELEALFAQASRDTAFHSMFSAYWSSEAYKRIVEEYGETALPTLLEAVRNEQARPEEEGLGWWPLNAIGEIAKRLDKPFGVPREDVVAGWAGYKYPEVRDTVLDWGREQGYLEQDQGPTVK